MQPHTSTAGKASPPTPKTIMYVGLAIGGIMVLGAFLGTIQAVMSPHPTAKIPPSHTVVATAGSPTAPSVDEAITTPPPVPVSVPPHSSTEFSEPVPITRGFDICRDFEGVDITYRPRDFKDMDPAHWLTKEQGGDPAVANAVRYRNQAEVATSGKVCFVRNGKDCPPTCE